MPKRWIAALLLCAACGRTPDADAGPSDAAASDAERGDAGTLDSGGPAAPCDTIYGGLDGYRSCREEADRCEFLARTDGRSCTDACVAVGRACLEAYVSRGDSCDRAPDAPNCDRVAFEQICICIR